MKSKSTPDASVRRRRAVHRPTRPERVGSASLHPNCDDRRFPPNHEMKEGSGEACAFRERRPLGRATATNACVRSDDPTQRSPAVVRRRLGPRHAMTFRVSLSAPLRLCVSALNACVEAFASLRLRAFALRTGWVGSLRDAFVFALDGSVSSLCLCGSARGWVGDNPKFEIRNPKFLSFP